MVAVTFIQIDGGARTVEAANGTSAMQAAIAHRLVGINADCGGLCSCATCHVYIDEKWAAKLPPPEAEENDLLDFTAAMRKPTSRLACQITLNVTTDGLVLHMPPNQS